MDPRLALNSLRSRGDLDFLILLLLLQVLGLHHHTQFYSIEPRALGMLGYQLSYSP